MKVNERIREQRKKMRYTQKELADKVNVSAQVISNWERGYTEPSADDINKLSEVLDCTSDYLLGRSDNPDVKLKMQKISRDELDIAKRMQQLREDLMNAEGLAFDGEPMSDEARESLLEAMEFGVRLAKKNNKKFIPKKYRQDDEE